MGKGIELKAGEAGYDGVAQSYLFSLDKRDKGMNSQNILLPRLDAKTLEDVTKRDVPFIVANDWSRVFVYEFGAWVIDEKNEIVRLQEKTGRILNKSFVFECGRSDHKGLIAIEIERDTKFFVMNYSGIRIGKRRQSVELFFDTDFVDEEYIEMVKNIVLQSDIDADITIQRKWLVLYGDDYTKMVEQLPVTLI